MTRAHNTYRADRRNAWAVARRFASISWREWNNTFHGSDGFDIPQRLYPSTLVRPRDRSKYMPHQGKREMARRVRQAA